MTRAARLALLIALAPLGGCVTADGSGPEVAAAPHAAAPAVVAGPPVAAPPAALVQPATAEAAEVGGPVVGPVAVKDDLLTAKDQFAREHYGLAELHFRRAVEADKTDPEAWLGLAASYDKLRRYKLADRAYAAALKLTGPTPAFLNNRGFSFLQRGDLRRASEDLTRAAALAPDDERILANLRTLDARVRERF